MNEVLLAVSGRTAGRMRVIRFLIAVSGVCRASAHGAARRIFVRHDTELAEAYQID